MEVTLLVVGGDAKTKEMKIRLPVVIGRGREATLTLAQPLVSRQHCQIYEAGGKVMVRDLGSLNGTFVNNERVSEAELSSGQLLTIGTVTLRTEFGGPAAPDIFVPVPEAADTPAFAINTGGATAAPRAVPPAPAIKPSPKSAAPAAFPVFAPAPVATAAKKPSAAPAPVAESIAEPVAEPIAEPVVEAIAEAIEFAEPAAEPIAEAVPLEGEVAPVEEAPIAVTIAVETPTPAPAPAAATVVPEPVAKKAEPAAPAAKPKGAASPAPVSPSPSAPLVIGPPPETKADPVAAESASAGDEDLDDFFKSLNL